MSVENFHENGDCFNGFNKNVKEGFAYFCRIITNKQATNTQ